MQVLFRRFHGDGKTEALHHFGDVGADQVSAQKRAGLLVEDHLDETARFTSSDRLAVGLEREATDLDVQPLFLGALFGDTD